MFENSSVVDATDIVATHTYQNPITPSNWSSLSTAAIGKPIWVTEAGNLHSPNSVSYTHLTLPTIYSV